MTNLTYKDHLIYLALISFLAFAGACFTSDVMVNIEPGLNLKAVAIPFLIFNAFLIYFLILIFFKETLIAFAASALYLVAPTHFDIFVYPLQFQTLLAETCLLSFFVLYQIRHIWKSLIPLLIAVLLNTKLVMLIPFLWGMKRISNLQKAYSVAFFSVVMIYLIPLMYKESFFSFNQFKTIFYIWENLILATNISVLNISTINPGHYSFLYIVISLVTLLALYIYGLKRNYDVLKIAIGLIIASLLGAFIPYKQVFRTEEYFYFYLPSFYPMVILSVLFLIAFVLSAFKSREKVSKVLIGILGVYWLGSAIYVQRNFQNIMQEWSHSVASLPEDFNYEEKIKLKYARLLIDNGYTDEAVRLINKTKIKIPVVQWYAMLLEIAFQKGDQEEIDKIYKELSVSRAPFENTDLEEE